MALLQAALFWTALAVIAGALIVPMIAAAKLGNIWPLLLTAFGGAGIMALRINALDVSTFFGRAIYGLMFFAFVVCLVLGLFVISRARIASRLLRFWLIVAVAVLAIEAGCRAFPAHDSFAINPGVKFFWPDWVRPFNNFGHRDRDFATFKPPGTFRILLLGDSFTEGAGLGRDERFGGILERNLNVLATGRFNVEVYNLGHAGYNTQEEMEVLRRDGPKLHPDLVVINYVMNDAETRPLEVPYHLSPEWFAYVHGVFLQRLGSYAYYRLFTRINLSKTSYPSLLAYWTSQHDKDGRGWNAVLTSLDEMEAWLRDRNVPGVAVIWPFFNQEPPEAWVALHQQVTAEFERRRFQIIDLLPTFARRSRRFSDFALTSIDAHPGAEANRIVAEQLTNAIATSPYFAGLPR